MHAFAAFFLKMKYLLTLFLVLSSSLFCISQINFEWQHPIPTGHHYSDVQLIGSNTVVAIGLDGTFIRSDNGGTTWNYYYIPTESVLTALCL